MEGGKKVSLCHFLGDQKIAISWGKKGVLGHPTAVKKVRTGSKSSHGT